MEAVHDFLKTNFTRGTKYLVEGYERYFDFSTYYIINTNITLPGNPTESCKIFARERAYNAVFEIEKMVCLDSKTHVYQPLLSQQFNVERLVNQYITADVKRYFSKGATYKLKDYNIKLDDGYTLQVSAIAHITSPGKPTIKCTFITMEMHFWDSELDSIHEVCGPLKSQ